MRPDLRASAAMTAPFFTWLRFVAKRVAIDYMRGHPEYIDRRRSAAVARAVSAGRSPGSRLAVGRVPGVIHLPGEPAGSLWIQSQDDDEIARRLELPGAAAAERRVRAAIERLRRHVRTSSGTR
jgi:hypothetical protein